jgi:hypothetical protein
LLNFNHKILTKRKKKETERREKKERRRKRNVKRKEKGAMNQMGVVLLNMLRKIFRNLRYFHKIY